MREFKGVLLPENYSEPINPDWGMKVRPFMLVWNANHYGNFGWAVTDKELAALRKVGGGKVGKLDKVHLRGHDDHTNYISESETDTDGCVFKPKSKSFPGIKKNLSSSGFNEVIENSRVEVFPEV